MHILRILQTRAIRWALLSAVFAGLATYMILANIFSTQTVVVANNRIAAGTKIKREQIAIRRIPADLKNKRTATDINKVIGKYALTERLPGDQIVISGLGSERSGRPSIEPGSVLVSLAVRDFGPISGHLDKDRIVTLAAIRQVSMGEGPPRATMFRNVRVIESKLLTKLQDLQKADAIVLLELPADAAETMLAMESKSYFKIVLESGETFE